MIINNCYRYKRYYLLDSMYLENISEVLGDVVYDNVSE